jgi:lipopolysaccharide transport system permease protein
VFYQSSAIPRDFATLYAVNPMVAIVDSYRSVLLNGTAPDPGPLLIITALSVVLLFFGVKVFRQTSHRFGDEL